MAYSKTSKVFMVWVEDESEPSAGYWELFDSLEDAYSTNEGKEIYEAVPKRLGKFKKKVEFILIPDKKPKKRKKK